MSFLSSEARLPHTLSYKHINSGMHKRNKRMKFLMHQTCQKNTFSLTTGSKVTLKIVKASMQTQPACKKKEERNRKS